MARELTADDVRVLLLPPTGRDAKAMQRVFGQAGIDCTVYFSLPALCEALKAGAGMVVVSEESLAADDRCLVAHLEAQPVWSDLPIVVLARSGAESPQLASMLPGLRNVSVIERPMRVTTLITTVRSALRARLRQYEVREHLTVMARADRSLRMSQERLRLAVAIAGMGTFEIDLRSDAVIVNDAGRGIYGWPPDEPLTFAKVQERFHPEDRSEVMRRVAAALDPRGTGEFEIEQRIIRTDGGVRWIRVRGRAFFEPVSEGGSEEQRRAVSFLGTYLDVTDQKDAERSREQLLAAERAARAEAERAGRMKDEFLATVSHEIRTPLHAILGWTRILVSGGAKDGEALAEGLAVIQRNARAQAQIIDDLLDMSRIISGRVRLEVQRMDLREVIAAALDAVRPAAAAREVRLLHTIDPQAVSVSGDPGRLQQVLWNLLTNAVKFTDRGGEVHVTLERINGHVEVSVADTGQGIRGEFLPYVFDRFSQADATTTRPHGGLGLGLSIVKHLTELHGGSVRVDSAGEDRGTTFVVTLPREAAPPPDQQGDTDRVDPDPPGLSPPEDRGVWLTGVRALIVDDEADARSLLRRELEGWQATVDAADCMATAMAMLERRVPDILISDIGMPGGDGYELIRRVRALPADRGGAVPAIALTAFARPDDRRRALEAGYQMHISKPVEPAALGVAIKSLVAADKDVHVPP